jgi:DNA-binding response OmpR family regulator
VRATPKVVLLDIRMPGMNGLSTLRHIRAQHPNLPVIIMTQVDEEQARAEALALCSHEYLVKPFSFEHLKTILLTKVFV